MTIAKGRSTITAEIDLMNQSLRSMIDSIESYFCGLIDSLKSQLFDIEYSYSMEEKQSISTPVLRELEDAEVQLMHARNKLLISIYSICEVSLAGICDYYRIPLKYSLSNKSKTNYYLSDYLFSLDIDYTNEGSASYIVYHAIRPLRNYLTHSKRSVHHSTEIANRMVQNGFLNVVSIDSPIKINSIEVLYNVLYQCTTMLHDCDLKCSTININTNHE